MLFLCSMRSPESQTTLINKYRKMKGTTSLKILFRRYNVRRERDLLSLDNRKKKKRYHTSPWILLRGVLICFQPWLAVSEISSMSFLTIVAWFNQQLKISSFLPIDSIEFFFFYTPRPAPDCVSGFGAKPYDWCRK